MTTMKKTALRFTNANSYFPKGTWAFNLPSGFSCPGALLCLRYANRKTGKQTAGTKAEFQCYSAHVERFPSIRNIVWDNFITLRRLKTCEAMVGELEAALPEKAKKVRVHAHGDFFSQEYFDAWMQVARNHPERQFWAFTKSIDYWVNRLGSIPDNFCLQASQGGKMDALAAEHKLKTAYMVSSEAEAKERGLLVDYDDTLAMTGTESFALVKWHPFRASRKERFTAALATGNEQAATEGFHNTPPKWPGGNRKRNRNNNGG